MAYISKNSNPCIRTVGDCAVRALAEVTGQSWESVYRELCDIGFNMCDMPNANEVIHAFLRKRGFKKKLIPDYLPDYYAIEDFALDHPYGLFVVGTGSHVVPVIDGNYIDLFDSGQEIPIFYFEKGEMR